MSTGMDKLAKELRSLMTASDDRKPKPYDAQAEVLRVDGNTAWVHIPGGVNETPVRLTLNAKQGDIVNVRVAGGAAWITGNGTNPPTDDTVANSAKKTASRALSIGDAALEEANRARDAADLAMTEAGRAHEAADSAASDAARAQSAANTADAKAVAAGTAAATAEANAQTAITNAAAAAKAAQDADDSAQEALKNASDAAEAADNAQDSADDAAQNAKNATRYANSALYQLGEFENIIGSLEWIASHGHYVLTQDSTPIDGKMYFIGIEGYYLTKDEDIDPEKTYYTRNGTGSDTDPYIYTAVSEPVKAELNNYYEYGIASYEKANVTENDDPSQLGLYILDSVDEAIQHYLTSHLTLDRKGLWVIGNDNLYKILLSSTGMEVQDEYGDIVSQFGENILFSAGRNQRIGGDESYIEFDHTTDELNIYASNINIGSLNASRAITDLQSDISRANTTILAQQDQISNQQLVIDNLSGYVDINPSSGYIRVGKRGIQEYSYVEVGASDPSNPKVSIFMDNKEVAYFSNEKLYAPSAVITNLYMQTENSDGDYIGALGFVMRSNKHLSLKRLK